MPKRISLSPALEEKLLSAQKVVILSGAGVSAESGISTFRDKDGLWEKFKPEDLATPSAFERNPKLVWEWYEFRRKKIQSVKPNLAHLALAQMEKFFYAHPFSSIPPLLRQSGSLHLKRQGRL